MISFKQFLAEAEMVPMAMPDEIDPDNLQSFLEEHCSNALSEFQRSGSVLYRGFRHDIVPGVYDPSTGTRSSENTSNWYTTLLDTNPANAAWPKRSKAFITITSSDHARGFADSADNVAAVFPFDGVPIGEILADDLWTLIPTNPFALVKKYPHFNRLMSILFGGSPVLTYEEAMTELDKIPDDELATRLLEIADNMYRSTPMWIESIVKTPEKIRHQAREFIEEVYTYDRQKRNFKLHDSVSGLDSSHECWFSGKCVIIPQPFIEYIT